MTTCVLCQVRHQTKIYMDPQYDFKTVVHLEFLIEFYFNWAKPFGPFFPFFILVRLC